MHSIIRDGIDVKKKNQFVRLALVHSYGRMEFGKVPYRNGQAKPPVSERQGESF